MSSTGQAVCHGAQALLFICMGLLLPWDGSAAITPQAHFNPAGIREKVQHSNRRKGPRSQPSRFRVHAYVCILSAHTTLAIASSPRKIQNTSRPRIPQHYRKIPPKMPFPEPDPKKVEKNTDPQNCSEITSLYIFGNFSLVLLPGQGRGFVSFGNVVIVVSQLGGFSGTCTRDEAILPP